MSHEHPAHERCCTVVAKNHTSAKYRGTQYPVAKYSQHRDLTLIAINESSNEAPPLAHRLPLSFPEESPVLSITLSYALSLLCRTPLTIQMLE
jgi:hypothetical protein